MARHRNDLPNGRDGEPSTTALVLVASLVIAGAAGSAIMAYLMQA